MRGLTLPITVNGTCWDQIKALSLKYAMNIQPLLLGFSFPTEEVGLMGDTCLHRVYQGALSTKAVSQSITGFFSLRFPADSAKNDGHPWGLAESSARNRHRHLSQGNTFLDTYLKTIIALLLGKRQNDFCWNISSVQQDATFLADASSGKRNFLRSQWQILEQAAFVTEWTNQ